MSKKNPNINTDQRPHFDYVRSAGYNFTVISNKLSRGLTKILRTKADIGVIEWRVIVHLALEAPMIASDIGRIATIDKALVSKAFKSLEAKGLIALGCFPNEQRPRLAKLTDKGEILYDEILPLVLAREAAVMTGLTTGEIDMLFETLEKIRNNLELL
ncbi:MAG: MarR family winged helix-turn-helix transcriptional regulator [Chloroflexota bacterium]